MENFPSCKIKLLNLADKVWIRRLLIAGRNGFETTWKEMREECTYLDQSWPLLPWCCCHLSLCPWQWWYLGWCQLATSQRQQRQWCHFFCRIREPHLRWFHSAIYLTIFWVWAETKAVCWPPEHWVLSCVEETLIIFSFLSTLGTGFWMGGF
jgi:hypothetical protein